MKLSEQDLGACSAALHSLYEPMTLPEFPGRLLPVLSDLVPVDHVSYNDFDARRHQYVFRTYPERAELEDLAPLFDTHFRTHPLFEVFQQGTTAPVTISDQVTLRQFKQTAMYQEVYRRLGTKHQMIFFLHSEASRRVGLALNRSQQDFSGRDRSVVGFLAPHIIRAHRNALTASRLSECLAQVGQGLGAMRRAVLLAGPDGTIRWSCDLAREWLREFFPDYLEGSGALPPSLKRWVTESERSASSGQPCFSEHQAPSVRDARLLVYCGKAGDGAVVIALVRERNAFEAGTLEGLGLTEREGHILFWISEAKTNPEIAAILGISPRTIHKHAEHIFAKLGVENRLQAQRLGWELRRV
jgi:DNA-binding CsgD family transcriptional regulator